MLFICRIRIYIHRFVSNKYFDNTILVLIIISSAFLALEDTTDRHATINVVSFLESLFGRMVDTVFPFNRNYEII